MPEPLLGEGDQVDVTVDRSRHVQPFLEVETEPEIALGEDRAVAADARGAFDDPRHTEAEAVDVLDQHASRLDAGSDAVLHKIQDDRGGLAVDPDRDRHGAEDVRLFHGTRNNPFGRRQRRIAPDPTEAKETLDRRDLRAHRCALTWRLFSQSFARLCTRARGW
jgi:hypothetical protein